MCAPAGIGMTDLAFPSVDGERVEGIKDGVYAMKNLLARIKFSFSHEMHLPCLTIYGHSTVSALLQ